MSLSTAFAAVAGRSTTPNAPGCMRMSVGRGALECARLPLTYGGAPARITLNPPIEMNDNKFG